MLLDCMQGSIYLNGVASVYEGQDQVPEKIRVETSEEHIDVNSAELFTVCMTSWCRSANNAHLITRIAPIYLPLDFPAAFSVLAVPLLGCRCCGLGPMRIVVGRDILCAWLFLVHRTPIIFGRSSIRRIKWTRLNKKGILAQKPWTQISERLSTFLRNQKWFILVIYPFFEFDFHFSFFVLYIYFLAEGKTLWGWSRAVLLSNKSGQGCLEGRNPIRAS